MVVVVKSAVIDVDSRSYTIEYYKKDSILGIIDYGVDLHYERYKTYRHRVFSPENIVVLGRGPFSCSRLLGSNRLVFVFRSPVSRGLHISTMGGAGYKFCRTSLDAVVIKGRAREPSIVVVESNSSGNTSIRVERIDEDTLLSIWRGYRGYRGTWALSRYLLDIFSDVFEGGKRARSIVVGPAARSTIAGSIVSIDSIGGRLLENAFDLAGRGGGGSVLFRAHNVVAVVFGGDYDSSRDYKFINNYSEVEKISEKLFSTKYYSAVEKATTKYRYDKEIGAGGTFGVNYPLYRDLLPYFSYKSFYLSRPARIKLADKILENLWSRPRRDMFLSREKPWGTCGEPCTAVCKKIWRETKLDYEPSNGLGPFIGILYDEDMIELVKLVDEYGLDAIEAGHTIAWFFELLSNNIVAPEELGINRKPLFDPIDYDVGRDSSWNKEIAKKLLENLVESSTRSWLLELVASRGLREAAKILDSEKNSSSVDYLVYTPYGAEGYMTPNYYCAPGLLAPMPIQGRYWTVYSPSLDKPREYAGLAVERAISEYLIDNSGFCRFHRKWVEKILEELYRVEYSIETSLRRHAIATLKTIYMYQLEAGSEPRPWESKRAREVIALLGEELGEREWTTRFFGEDGAREWWSLFLEEVEKILGVSR